MNTSRDQILRRLREAPPFAPAELPPVPPDETLYADFPAAHVAAMAATFGDRLQALSGEVYRVSSMAEATREVARLTAAEEGVVVQPAPELRQLIEADEELAARCTWLPEAGLDSTAMSEMSVGITSADFLIARTGSIVCRASHCGGRRLSVLPPIHLVLAITRQLVPSLDRALAQIQTEDDPWSSLAIITGPSRTADIEKILVLGAHGPKRLAVILLEDDT